MKVTRNTYYIGRRTVKDLKRIMPRKIHNRQFTHKFLVKFQKSARSDKALSEAMAGQAGYLLLKNY